MSSMQTESMSGLFAFVHAAEMRSYVAAARALGVSASAIGKSVLRLEEKLGVVLFHRTTRSISLTPEGTLFFERCQRILADLKDAEAELARTRERPRGRIRISAPAAWHRFLSPLLPEFARTYPDVELDIDYSDRVVDVISEGFDLVIRSGELADTRLTARFLTAFRFLVVASPGYLRRSGAPKALRELSQHACLAYRFPSTGKIQAWRFEGNEHVPLRATMTCNSVEALTNAARGGIGLAYVPDFSVAEDLTSGALVETLAAMQPIEGAFRLLWPQTRLLSKKVRVLIDYLTARSRKVSRVARKN